MNLAKIMAPGIVMMLLASSAMADETASTLACFVKIRNEQSKSYIHSADQARLVKARNINSAQLSLVDSTYSRSLGDSLTNIPNDLGKASLLSAPGFHLSSSFDISSISDDTEQFVLNLSQTLVVYRGSKEMAQYDWQYGYDKNCMPTLVVSSAAIFTFNSDGTALGKSHIETIGQTPADTTMLIPAGPAQNSLVQSGSWTSASSSLAQIKSQMAKAKMAGQNTDSVNINQGQITIVKLGTVTDAPTASFLNPLTGKETSFNGLKLEADDNAFANFIYESDNYQITKVDVPGASPSYSDTVPEALWLKQSIDVDKTQRVPKLSGFSSTDLIAADITYTVSGQGSTAPALFNSSQYFTSVVSISLPTSWQYTIRASSNTSPGTNSLNINDPILPEDKPFLESSYYIQLDQVASLVSAVKAQMNGNKSRAKLAQTIATVVANRIQYDYTETNTGTVDMRTVKDILKTGKGVCQHYALVYVAVARAMGLPARVVEGYLMTPGSIGSHAWVEAKINNSTWWPLEPQTPQGTRNNLNYFPVGIMSAYEIKSISALDTANLAEAHNFEQWMTTNITLVSHQIINTTKKYVIQNAFCTMMDNTHFGVIATVDSPVIIDQNTGAKYIYPNVPLQLGDEISATSKDDAQTCNSTNASMHSTSSVTMHFVQVQVNTANGADPDAIHYQVTGIMK